MSTDASALHSLVGTTSGPLGHAVLSELQPIIEAIAASLRDGGRFANRGVSVTLPAPDGQTLVVSVHNGTRSRRPASETSVRGLDARQLRVVNGTIQERIGEPISVSMLSTIAGLSRSHFSHAFRASTGRTPHDYIVRLRIDRAKKLMIQANLPLSEIALATGFSDQAHFSNTFRRATGMTPTQWRRVPHNQDRSTNAHTDMQ